MRCPKCIEEGRRSTVTEGMSGSTLMYFPKVYDEDGRLMPRGRNRTTTNYSCSNGHRWTETD